MRAYEVILRLYPADHPRDEMLGVLEETGRPWHREAPSLILGGLRARTGAGQPASLRWLYAARAAALMLLVTSPLAPVDDLRWSVQLRTDLMVATWVCAGLAAAAVIAGTRLPALAMALAALVLSGLDQTSMPAIAGYSLAAGLLVIPGRSLPVRNPLPLALALAWSAGFHLPESAQLALVAALALWTVVDERILLATGLALLAGLIAATGELAEVDDARGLLLLATLRLGAPLALVVVAAALVHHRTRIYSTGA